MISTTRVLDEMQRQLTHAKSSSNEAAVRESIAAIQSLCGLILASNGEQTQTIQASPSFTEMKPREGSVPLQTGPQSLEGQPLEEEDANGGSLFDF
ncbi:YwdI family protein [Sporosarcina aquimarina]|uniref:YwdI family protein n=1 Tax=Sporosarcina aquimarina TaxID=114975 RepID=A0ABU4FV43_9BACL|nr:YwdI family protein [Sporosarcina aquimarina]MDW0108585.1 YwdI family protein [Sporosarcina aquimarina]